MRAIDPTKAAPTPPCRRFTLLDGLAMIVPIAAALALSRPFVRNYSQAVHARKLPPWLSQMGIACGVASRLVAMMMIAMLAVRLRRPRPSLRRISRQPGAVACAASTAAMAIGGLTAVSLQIFRSPGFGYPQDYWPWAEASILPAVLASWVALAIGRRWRGEPGWIDRAGRLLGAYWLLLGLFRFALSFYSPADWSGYP